MKPHLEWYFEQTRKFPMLDVDEEQRLARHWRDTQDAAVARELLGSHLRLVVKIARGFGGYGMPLAELVAEGNVGLMQAFARFEPEREFRFATYAMWWIGAGIKEHVLRNRSLVKMGTTAEQKKLFFRLRALKSEFGELGEGDLAPGTVTQIARQLKVSEDQVVEMNARLAGMDRSLAAPMHAHGYAEWQDSARKRRSASAICRSTIGLRTGPRAGSLARAERPSGIAAKDASAFSTRLEELDHRADGIETGHIVVHLVGDILSGVSTQPYDPGPWPTGHARGLITINIAEADDAERERARKDMAEPYRTLPGHFRHEIGHYYWERMVRDGPWLEWFRELFGDERQDYGACLQAHHAMGALPDWQQRFVSSYASAHPWEDFAETWAHYLHIVDTLETAAAFGLRVRPKAGRDPALAMEIAFDPYRQGDFDALIQAWLPLTYAVNSLNQGMGQPDLYPFVLAPPVMGKLRFVHGLIHQSGV